MRHTVRILRMIVDQERLSFGPTVLFLTCVIALTWSNVYV